MSPYVIVALSIVIFLSSCQSDLDQSMTSEFNEIKSSPEVPEDIESLLSISQKKNGYFVYPYAGQKLDREGNYIFKANRNSSTSRYAILLYQDGVYSWNNYWGSEGVSGMHYVLPTEVEYFQFKLGEALVFLWHWTGSAWQFKTGFEVNLYHNWADPVPTANRITSLCGWRTLGGALDCHSGTDLGHTNGGATVFNDPVRSVAAGVVVESNLSSAGSVTIEHANGRYSTRYRHLNSIQSGITVGRSVSKGQIIGRVGNRGTSVTHLHFEYFFGYQHEQFLSNPDNYYDCALANFCYISPLGITRVNNENDINMSLSAYCQGSDHFDRNCD